MNGMRLANGALLAAVLLAAHAAVANPAREAAQARARERSAALDEGSRAAYVALVERVSGSWVDRHGYTEPELVGAEIAEAAVRRIEKDRAAAKQDDEAYRTNLLTALDSGLIVVSADEVTLTDPARAANFVWRRLSGRVSVGVAEGSIEAVREPGRRRVSSFRARDASGRALLSDALDPEPRTPPLPTAAAVLAEVDWRQCIDAERLRPRLLERYRERALSHGLEGSAAASYSECMTGRVIRALEEHDRAPRPRHPPLDAFSSACLAEGSP